MDRTEWNQSADSLPEPHLEETGDTAVVANQTFPMLEHLVQKVDLVGDRRLPEVEAVINKVIELGESNHTIERILERKHEVKDFAASEGQKAQYASRIGEILEQRKETYPSDPSSYSGAQKRLGIQTKSGLFASNSLYSQAVKYGLISGLLALLSAVILVTALNS